MKYLCILILSLSSLIASGQVYSKKDSRMDSLFLMNVSSISEFISRFNNESYHPLLKETADTLRNKHNALSLFDMQSDMIRANEDLVMQFAEDVVQNGYTISYGDSLWFAEAECLVKFDEKEYKITLIFTTEKDSQGQLAWVLYGVGDVYGKLIPKSIHRSIDPTDNEINFLSLSDIFSYDSANAFGYISHEYKPDQVSIFLSLIYMRKIEFITVNHISYYFLNVPGYAFVVSYQNKKSGNSGWLISSLNRMTDSEKYAYAISLLNF